MQYAAGDNFAPFDLFRFKHYMCVYRNDKLVSTCYKCFYCIHHTLSSKHTNFSFVHIVQCACSSILSTEWHACFLTRHEDAVERLEIASINFRCYANNFPIYSPVDNGKRISTVFLATDRFRTVEYDTHTSHTCIMHTTHEQIFPFPFAESTKSHSIYGHLRGIF